MLPAKAGVPDAGGMLALAGNAHPRRIGYKAFGFSFD
jgi:hypothetical protein